MLYRIVVWSGVISFGFMCLVVFVHPVTVAVALSSGLTLVGAASLPIGLILCALTSVAKRREFDHSRFGLVVGILNLFTLLLPVSTVCY